jgi:argininosuccinate lyase/amino-acid N-acetyltransferase
LKHDIRASREWAAELNRLGVLTQDEFRQADQAFTELARRYADSSTEIPDSGDEDVHSFLEKQLGLLCGTIAKKIHTGRSRNDQVATAFRLWTLEQLKGVEAGLGQLILALLNLAQKAPDAALPGYTHLQRAQPIVLGHWCLAYREMFVRDLKRVQNAITETNVCPLGSGALAGSPARPDRPRLCAALGMARPTLNSLDAVSDRDFLVESAAAGSLIMAHLSRLCEDVILYTSFEFGFFQLSDSVSTGSSLMPQKKNPDPFELIRGKTGRVYGTLMSLLTVLKGIPLAYNKDLQEDKEAAVNLFQTLHACLEAAAVSLDGLTPQTDRMNAAASVGYMNATDLADYLVARGVAFRNAHECAGKIVRLALAEKKELQELSLTQFKNVEPLIEQDVFEWLSLEKVLSTKDTLGGTAPSQVRAALKKALSETK